MGYLGSCKNRGQTAAVIQVRLPAQLHARWGAAGRAACHRPSDCDSSFRLRPNDAVPSGLYGRPGRKISALLAALLFAASGAAQAATQPATIAALSPSLVDVQKAISSAVDGDTVNIPAGTATWTSALTITKGITLIGQTTTDSVAGTAVDKTIIIQANAPSTSSAPLIRVSSTLGKSYRVSGLTFQDLHTATNYNGAIILAGNSNSVRLDHCHFKPMPFQMISVAIAGAIYGVADHNVMEMPKNEAFFFSMNNWPNPNGTPGQYGDGSWATPTNFGTEQFFFVEDNYIKNISSPFNEGAGTTDDRDGARWVFRHNHCYDTHIASHGTEGGRFRGGRAREIYNNDFHYAHAHGTGGIRSGVTITHDNTWDGVQPTHGLVLEAFRAFFKWNSQSLPSWGGGTGDNPWDVNDTRNGPFQENGFSYNPVNGLYASGTASSGSKSTLVDTTKSWKPNQWQYFTAKRLSDNQVAFIMSNTSNALTVMYYTDSGGGAVWAAGNQYQIHRPLILIDQPGRGKGDLITRTATTIIPINSTTGAAAWPNQALEPTYCWNDKYTPTGASVKLQSGGGNLKLQQEGRDYYNNTPMPGYKPYTYPHPLTSDLAPPSDLRVTP
jgi:hypothetical protein